METIIDIDGQVLSKFTDDLGNVSYFNSKFEWHRLKGPAWILNDGTQVYFLNNKKHRIGGPAWIKADGSLLYFFEGFLHRIDGPAIIGYNEDGSKYQEYFIEGNWYSEEEYIRAAVAYKLKHLLD